MQDFDIPKNEFLVSTSIEATSLGWTQTAKDGETLAVRLTKAFSDHVMQREGTLDLKAAAKVITESKNPVFKAAQTIHGADDETVTFRAYPHLFLAAQPALSHVRAALQAARLALEAYGETDIDDVASRLSAIAVHCAAGHPLTKFNESFGSVVSFVRRATLAADAADVSRSSLNSLVQVLSVLTKNAALTLLEASELTDTLTDNGWDGESHDITRLLALLLGYEASEFVNENTKL